MSETDPQLTLICNDAEATRSVGAAIGAIAPAGCVVLLQGDLGAGKTVMAQGIGRGLDAPTVVNSPTFVLMNEHLGGRLPLRHADLYRLDDLDLIAELGLDQAADGGVLLVEWPERAADTLPADHVLVRIAQASDEFSEDQLDASPRRISLTASGESARRLLDQLAPLVSRFAVDESAVDQSAVDEAQPAAVSS